MNMPIMLRSTHEREMRLERYVLNELKDDYVDLNNELHKVNKENLKLGNSNSKLSTKLTASEVKLNELGVENKNLISSNKESEIKLKEALKEIEKLKQKLSENSWCLEESKKKIDRLEKDATIHRIMKKQLKDMCISEKTGDQLIFKDKVNAIKVFNLAGLMG